MRLFSLACLVCNKVRDKKPAWYFWGRQVPLHPACITYTQSKLVHFHIVMGLNEKKKLHAIGSNKFKCAPPHPWSQNAQFHDATLENIQAILKDETLLPLQWCHFSHFSSQMTVFTSDTALPVLVFPWLCTKLTNFIIYLCHDCLHGIALLASVLYFHSKLPKMTSLVYW